jgi:hypothetical protein
VAECVAFSERDSVGEGTLEVSRGHVVVVSAIAPEGAADNTVSLEVLGKRWKIANATGDGAWSDAINVDDYADWAVGLYELVWESRAADGELLREISPSVEDRRGSVGHGRGRCRGHHSRCRTDRADFHTADYD